MRLPDLQFPSGLRKPDQFRVEIRIDAGNARPPEIWRAVLRILPKMELGLVP